MENNKLKKITGVVIIISILLSMVGMIMLSQLFEWEGKPMGTALTLYYEGGPLIRILWTIFALGCFLIGPLSLLLHKVINTEKTPLLYIGTTMGVIASVAYLIGLARWVLLAGALAPLYNDPAVSLETKNIIETVFYAINAYAGNGFGETLAPITHGLWLIFLGYGMTKSTFFPKPIAFIQMIGGLFIMMRPLEYTGLGFMAEVGDFGVQAWAILFLIVGFILIFKKDLQSKS